MKTVGYNWNVRRGDKLMPNNGYFRLRVAEKAKSLLTLNIGIPHHRQ
jgi:hypothetical protein